MPDGHWRNWLWSLRAKRQRWRWWMAPIRWRCGDTRVFVLPGQCWDEFWLQSYPNKFASLVRVVRAGSVKFDTQEAKERIAMGVFDNLPKPGGAGVPSPNPVDPGFMMRFPTLWQFLTEDYYGPDQPRERSGLTLHIEAGAFKVYLSEKTREAGIDATGPTFEAALDALELRLTSAAPGWRSTASKGKKKKK